MSAMSDGIDHFDDHDLVRAHRLVLALINDDLDA